MVEVGDTVATVAREVAGGQIQVGQSAVGIIRADNVEASMAGVGMVFAGGDVSVTQGGGRTFVAGGDLRVQQGGAATLVSAGSASIQQGGVGIALAPRVDVGGGGIVGIALAPRVDVAAGGKVLLGPREALLAGAAIGIAVGLVRSVVGARRRAE